MNLYLTWYSDIVLLCIIDTSFADSWVMCHKMLYVVLDSVTVLLQENLL